jgi:hypothetical protein
MKFIRVVCPIILVAVSLFAGVASAKEYSFKLSNTTDSKIKELLVSEDGEEWGYFDIGSGIASGSTQTLVWDESSNSEDCKQYFKVVFNDGEESDPVIFDFCEEDLELEF